MAGRVLAEPAPHAARIDWPAAFKETGLAAFVALERGIGHGLFGGAEIHAHGALRPLDAVDGGARD